MKQLDIYWVDLDPARGVETQKMRPCVVLQGNYANQHSRQFVIAPLLRGHKDWPYVINITPTAKNKLDAARHINLKQMKGMDAERFGKQRAQLEPSYAQPIHDALRWFFEMDGHYAH